MKYHMIIAVSAAALLGACAQTPEQQAALQCGAGTIGGAAVGAAVGNTFGGGSGNAIMTATGGAVGATAGSALSC